MFKVRCAVVVGAGCVEMADTPATVAPTMGDTGSFRLLALTVLGSVCRKAFAYCLETSASTNTQWRAEQCSRQQLCFCYYSAILLQHKGSLETLQALEQRVYRT
jgi:hypothetical protein